MKITALKTFIVPPRWLFLKVETDEGISGWGEPVLEGHAETLAPPRSHELEDFLIGQDPRRIEDIWQMIYRNGCYRGGPVLMSAHRGHRHGAVGHQGQGARACRSTNCWAARCGTAVRSYCWIGGDRPAEPGGRRAAACRRRARCGQVQHLRGAADRRHLRQGRRHHRTPVRRSAQAVGGGRWTSRSTSTAASTRPWRGCC